MTNIHDLLQIMVDESGSDLHIVAGAPPLVRIDGRMRQVDSESLTSQECLRLAYTVMAEGQQKEFERKKELDFSFGIASMGRFRANVYYQRGSVCLAIRYIPYEIKSINDLGLPKVTQDFVERPSGLVLVTGATGSGKSTTLAAMIDKINTTREGHILTIEDPIEFVHKHKKCMISQREVKADTDSFSSALRVALRQDPDFVLIGEMRDMETMEAAMTIAETGHLTLATLHTNSAAETINRIIDFFPENKQSQVRTQLSFVLQGVISQVLLPSAKEGRILASEVMVATPAIRAMIRDDKIHQVQSMLETGQKFGMQTMNACLVGLVLSKQVSKVDAAKRSPDLESFERLLRGRMG